MNDAVYGSIDADEDQDWFAFETGSGTEYRFRAINLNLEQDEDSPGQVMSLTIDKDPGASYPQYRTTLPMDSEVGASLELLPNTTYYVHVYGEYIKNSLIVTQGDYRFSISEPPRKTYLPNRLSAIGAEAFSNSGLACVYIPAACRSVGSKAFSDNASLMEAHFAEPDVKIAGDAFSGCAQAAIYAPAGGSVQAWAEDHGFLFVAE